MAKALLILPPWYTFLGDGFNELPIGLCSLAGYLNRHGHEAWVYNADLNAGRRQSAMDLLEMHKAYREELTHFRHPVWNRLREKIREMQPDVVGIHFKTGACDSVRQVARIAREAAPGCLIVAGGPHPSMMPEETAAMEEFDLIIRGEGEETLLEIIERLPFRVGMKIAGVMSRDGSGGLIDGGPREPIRDLDGLGEPDREHLIDREKYSDYAHGIIMTARGCPYQCTYCGSNAIWTRKVRYRSPESVVGEIEHVRREFGTRYFNFRDDTFTVNRNRTLEICRLMKERVPNIAWRCDTRADCIDQEMAAAMRVAGCVQANVGLESGSDRILKMIKKGETHERIAEGIGHLRRNRISVSAFVMMGFPTETAGDVDATLDFAISLKPDFLVMSILTPYPGTAIHDQAVELGLLAPDLAYADYYHQSPKMGLLTLEPEAFEQLKQRAFRRVDRYNRSIWRKGRRFLLIFAQNPKAAVEKVRSYFFK